MKIAIFGMGYVGVTAAACLSSQGHEVIGVDPNAAKVDAVNAGHSPIEEPGIEDLIAEAVAAGRLKATVSLTDEIAQCALAIVCVGTPSAADGSHNMTYIADVTRQIGTLIAAHPGKKLVVAYRSTMRPGTMEELITPILDDVMGSQSDRIELVYNPEFLRESVAVADFFAPPKIVVGTKTGAPCREIDIINEGIDAPVFYVKYREAEITKFVDNTFHAVKTTFANEIGRICALLDISAAEVHRIFVADTKLNVSPYYLRPGGAFGGSCLPKDVRALQHMARGIGANAEMIASVITSNEAHKDFLFRLTSQGVPHGAKVLMLGLAFKDKSDDLRESPNIDLARALITAGYDLSIFDPYVKPANLMGQNLGALSNSPFIRKLLISQAQMEETEFALAIDTRTIAKDFSLKVERIIDINRLA
jgi:GDP-mannose 6-dehydrogenase